MAKKKKVANNRPFATSSIPKKEVLKRVEEIHAIPQEIKALKQNELEPELKPDYILIQELMNQKAIQINKQEQLKKSPNPISITLNSIQQKLITPIYRRIGATYKECCFIYFRLLDLGFDIKIVKEAMKNTCSFEEAIGFILLNYDRKELPNGWGDDLVLQRSSTEEFVDVSESDLDSSDFVQVAQNLNVVALDDFEDGLGEPSEGENCSEDLSQYDLGSCEIGDIQSYSSIESNNEVLFIDEEQLQIERAENTIVEIKNLEYNWTGSDVCTLFFDFVKEKPHFNVKQIYRNGFKATLIPSPYLKTRFDPIYSEGIDIDFLTTTKQDAKDATTVIYN